MEINMEINSKPKSQLVKNVYKQMKILIQVANQTLEKDWPFVTDA